MFRLPSDLTNDDRARLRARVEGLPGELRVGEAYLTHWLDEQRLMLVAIVVDGALASWFLYPAASEQDGDRLALLVVDSAKRLAHDAAADDRAAAAAVARDVIRRVKF